MNKKQGNYIITFLDKATAQIYLLDKHFTPLNLEWSGFLLGTINDKQHKITIEELYLPKQHNSSGNTEINAVDEAKILDNPKYIGLIHSHHNMGAFHSATDYNIIEEIVKQPDTFYISVVIAKANKTNLTTIIQEDNFISTLNSFEFDALYYRNNNNQIDKYLINRMFFEFNKDIYETINQTSIEIDKFIEELKEYDLTKPLQNQLNKPVNEVIESIFYVQFPLLVNELFNLLGNNASNFITTLITVLQNEDIRIDLLEFIDTVDEELMTYTVNHSSNDFNDFIINDTDFKHYLKNSDIGFNDYI